MNLRASLLRRLEERFRSRKANRVCQTDMTDHPLSKKCTDTPMRPVNKLMGHHKMPRGSIFLHASYGTYGNNPLDTDFFHRKNIGPKIYFRGRDNMPHTVPGKKSHFSPLQFANNYAVRRRTKGSIHLYLFDHVQTLHLVQSATADHTEQLICHENLLH